MQVSFRKRMKMLIAVVALVAGIAGGVGAGAGSPASAATVNVTATVEGPDLVSMFRDYEYKIKVKNNGTGSVSGLKVDIHNLDLPLDYRYVKMSGTTAGFTCTVKQGAAILGARAECTGGTLAAGQEVVILLGTSTTLIFGTRTGVLAADIFTGSTSVYSGGRRIEWSGFGAVV